MRPFDNYFLQKEEPIKSCLQFLRAHILKQNEEITEAWKYGMPFFCYKGKMLCYLWVHKTLGKPYLGLVDGKRINHPDLLQEKRARMKIFLIDPTKDVPVRKLNALLKLAIDLRK
ncbi:MAG TPA: DUF1801 domain-containing protein [Cyclobacteriaceae bacterium]|jgi:hypothetical protein|nr:DUF1801 domain-containing protein [Cyclobacteriaceae bacterium]